MVSCDICGRDFRTTQASAGHRRFKHQAGGSDLPAMGPGGEGSAVSQRDLRSLADEIGAMLREVGDTLENLVKELGGLRDVVGVGMAQHVAGLCLESGCNNCSEQIAAVYKEGRESMDQEHRDIPEVAAALNSHQLLNTPVNMLTGREEI